LESRATYTRRAHEEFENKLTEYCDEIEGRAEAAGRERWRPKRAAERHLEWLVRWQVQQWSWTKLQREYSTPKNTIHDAVHATAELIQLTVRRGRPGRPRKKPSE
jgi:hypothetical protein